MITHFKRQRGLFLASARVSGAVFIIIAAAVAVYAFSEPVGGPPTGGSVTPPVNTGSTAQVKSGDLTVNNFTATGNITTSLGTVFGNIVKGNTQLCIGADCRTAWPSGGGGGLSGTGATNYLTKWTGAASLAGSRVQDDGVNSIYLNASTVVWGAGSGGVFITTPSQYGLPAVQGVTSGFAPGPVLINPVGGNVGIGTTNPTTKLQVSGGSISSTANVYSQVGSGRVAGIGELQTALRDYPGTVIFGCGWDSSSNISGCISPLPVYFTTNATAGADLLSEVHMRKLVLQGYDSSPAFTLSDENGGFAIMRRDAGFWWTAYGTNGDTGFSNYKAKFDANGVLWAPAKNFKIDDPLDPANKYLVHSTLEGPEIAVFYRGEGQLQNGRAEITLPAYFELLTRKDGRTVLLTNIDGGDIIYLKTQNGAQVMDGKFVVESSNANSSQQFNWEVKAVRGDIAPLQVEVAK